MSEVTSGFVVERLPSERQPLPSSSLTCYHLRCRKLHLMSGEKAVCLAVSRDCCNALTGLHVFSCQGCLSVWQHHLQRSLHLVRLLQICA